MITLEECIQKLETRIEYLKDIRNKVVDHIGLSDFLSNYMADVPVFSDLYKDITKEGLITFVENCELSRRERFERWQKIDTKWRQLASFDRDGYYAKDRYSFYKTTNDDAEHAYVIVAFASQNTKPRTYDFNNRHAAERALKEIGQDNLLFWFRGWEE